MLCCRKKSKTASKMNACRFIIGIVAVFLILCNISCSAHSGRTDAYGGHYNRSTGEYHFHHGKPEHSHPDGVCPYKAKNEKSEFNHDIYLYVAIGIIAVPFGVIFICSIITEIRTRKSKRKYTSPTFSVKYKYTTPNLKVFNDVPKDCYIDTNLLPQERNRPLFQSRYGVYKTRYGNCFHYKWCSQVVLDKCKLLHYYTALDCGYPPCSKCNPPNKKEDWYIEFENNLHTLT